MEMEYLKLQCTGVPSYFQNNIAQLEMIHSKLPGMIRDMENLLYDQSERFFFF